MVSEGVAAGAVWRPWMFWATLGEFVGFAFPAVVGVAGVGWPNGAMAAALLGAGAVEGALLGAAQVHVLRRHLPGIQRAGYILATAAAAVVAYALGLTPVLLGDQLTALPLWLVILVAVPVGLVLVASIGTAQWLVLRRELPRSAGWILTTAAAWAVGLLAFTAIASPLWQPGQSLVLAGLIGIGAGLVMAAVVAALTGVALVWLLRRNGVLTESAA